MVVENVHKPLGVVSEGTDEIPSDDKGYSAGVTPPNELLDQEAFNLNALINKDL